MPTWSPVKWVAETFGRRVADETPAQLNRPDNVEFGTTGLVVQGRRIEQEWAKHLRGRRGRMAFQEMRDNNAAIGAYMTQLRSTIRRVEYRVEANENGGARAEEAAEFLKSRVDALPSPLSYLFGEAGDTSTVHGFAPHEIVYCRHDDGRVGWAKFAIRSPTTVEGWDRDDKGDWTHMVQVDPHGKRGEVHIPREFLVNFRHEIHLDNPEGRSAFRNSHQAYYYSTELAQIEAIAADRDATGQLVVYAPPDVLTAPSGSGKAAIRSAVETQVQQNRSDERSGIIMPATKIYDGAQGKDAATGWGIENLRSGGKGMVDLDRVVRRWDSRILLPLAYEHALLGIDGSTSNAADSSKGLRQVRVLDGMIKNLVDTFNAEAVRRLYIIDGRYSPDEWARVVHSELDALDFLDLASAVSALLTSGGLQPDEALEQYLRSRGDLPPLDPESIRDDEDDEES